MLSWTWKASPPFSGNGTLEWEIGFTSNGTHYDKLSISQIYDSGDRYKFIGYCLGDKCNLAYDNNAWTNSAYRSIIFDTLPDASLYAKLSSMATVDGLISKIEVNGVTLLDLSSDTVTKDTLAKGVYAHDKTGKRIRGTMEASIAPTLQEKTVTPSTSAQSITADNGYDGLSKVTVNAMPTATQATPSITISSDGKITASATQSAGYVSAGTKSATKQLTTQAAKTVTPTTSNQTAVASGIYTTGAVTVKGDANLVAGNIKSGTTIFGVTGTYEGSGGGGYNLKTVSFTPSKNQTLKSYTINHNCGKIPKFVMVLSNCYNSSYLCSVCGENTLQAASFNLMSNGASHTATVTSKTFIFTSEGRYLSRHTYTFYFFY